MNVSVLYQPGLPEHGRCIGDVDAIPWEGYQKQIINWEGPSDHPVKDIYNFISQTWSARDPVLYEIFPIDRTSPLGKKKLLANQWITLFSILLGPNQNAGGFVSYSIHVEHPVNGMQTHAGIMIFALYNFNGQVDGDVAHPNALDMTVKSSGTLNHDCRLDFSNPSLPAIQMRIHSNLVGADIHIIFQPLQTNDQKIIYYRDL